MAISQAVNNSTNQSALAANRASVSTATVGPAATGSQVGTLTPAAQTASNINFTGGFNQSGLNPAVLNSLVALLTTLLQQIQSGGLGSNPQGQGTMVGSSCLAV